MYLEKAKSLIRRIHEAGGDTAEWLQLETEVSEFFSTLPKDQFDVIDQLFCDDGAGEMLYMVCDGIRYEKSKNETVYRVTAQTNIHQYTILTLDHDVYKSPSTPCFINGEVYYLVYYHVTPMPGAKPTHNKIVIEGDGDYLNAIVDFEKE